MATAADYLALDPEARVIVKTAAEAEPTLTEGQLTAVATLLRGAR